MDKLSTLFRMFLSKINDFSFLSDDITDSEIEEELTGYFYTARAKFYRCKKDLNIEENENGEKVFKEELTYFEFEVLATMMVVEYLMPQIVSSDKLKPILNDKSFETYSQSNQIRELRLLYTKLQSDVNKMITAYTYIDLGSD